MKDGLERMEAQSRSEVSTGLYEILVMGVTRFSEEQGITFRKPFEGVFISCLPSIEE